jgi:hypothetical protein
VIAAERVRHATRGPLLALQAIVLLGLGVAACGKTSSGERAPSQASSAAANATSTATSSGAPAGLFKPSKGDINFGKGDADSSPESTPDSDDNSVLHFGQAASTADATVVTALVKRYYAAAASDDGAAACKLMYSLLAESVVANYGRPPAGPPELRGETCGAVITKLFKQRHAQLASDGATLKLTGVRVQGNKAYALMRTATIPIGFVTLRREHGAWKLDAFFGGPVE